MKRSRKRRTSAAGLTLFEAIAALAIIGLAAAVAVPAMVGHASISDARTVAGIFTSLGYSLNNHNVALGDLGFINTIKAGTPKYPARLSQLVVQIRSGGATGDHKCGGSNYTGGSAGSDSGLWAAATPFSTLLITRTVGLTTPLGTIPDTVVKGSGNTASLVEIRLDSVQTLDAQNLDMVIDGALDSTSGQLRYVAGAVAGTHLIKFVLPGSVGC
jgi:type II secretory pathway pseudopilin PulG